MDSLLNNFKKPFPIPPKPMIVSFMLLAYIHIAQQLELNL